MAQAIQVLWEFLIDECLSPDLVAEAHFRGHYE